MKTLMGFQRETDPPPAGPFSDICFKYDLILKSILFFHARSRKWFGKLLKGAHPLHQISHEAKIESNNFNQRVHNVHWHQHYLVQLWQVRKLKQDKNDVVVVAPTILESDFLCGCLFFLCVKILIKHWSLIPLKKVYVLCLCLSLEGWWYYFL